MDDLHNLYFTYVIEHYWFCMTAVVQDVTYCQLWFKEEMVANRKTKDMAIYPYTTKVTVSVIFMQKLAMVVKCIDRSFVHQCTFLVSVYATLLTV